MSHKRINGLLLLLDKSIQINIFCFKPVTIHLLIISLCFYCHFVMPFKHFLNILIRAQAGQRPAGSVAPPIVKPRLRHAHTGMKFGVHIYHEQPHKKPSWTDTNPPTGSQPF